MASRSPPPSKRGRREDDDNESRRRKKLEKGKEPAAKDADEEPLFDDNKFTAELPMSAFRKLQGVGEAFDIKAHHDVYKDPTLKGLAFRIHGLAASSRTSPWSSGLPAAISSSTTAALTVTTAATTTTAAMTAAKAATVGLRLIDRLHYQLVRIMSVCFCVFVQFLDMNCLVCLSIMNCLVN
jgi:hypothetical protein